jgi:pilus assembly protein Flp/PilA
MFTFLQCALTRIEELILNQQLKELEMIKRFFRDETGLELSEYAVAAALVVAGVVVAFTVLGNAITTRISTLAGTITG